MISNKFVVSDFSVKKLDKRTDLSAFDCSKDDDLGLNEFIHNEALDYQKEGMGVTHLFYIKEDIAGYITVAMGSIGVWMTDLKVEVYDKKRYPALWLGRLAVQNKLRRQHVGKCMLQWSVGLAQKLSKVLGCRFLVLITKGEDRKKFYTECGFRICRGALKEEDMAMMYFQLF